MKSVICLMLIGVSLAYTQGRIIMPETPGRLPASKIELRSTRTEVDVQSGIATVRVEQVFFNPSSQRLEGEYVFMLPGEAQIYDFHLYVDGEKIKGELLDGNEAAEIYRNIVRSLRDPALLEYAGYGIFKARIFPIEPQNERKIEFSYAQILEYQQKDFKFTFPIRQIGMENTENFYLSLTIQEQNTIGNIFSPSHTIKIDHSRPKTARVTLEEKGTDRDFVLYYSVSQEQIHHTLISFRPRTDRNGFFILLLNPNQEISTPNRISKDVIFVMDVSGSMQGEKIRQAQQALKFCVESLHPEDRFDIITFSSTLNYFQGQWVNAREDAKTNARYFIDNLSASGGTNINEALQRALAMKSQRDSRSTDIIFLTDGLPTEGETGIGNILNNVKNVQKEFIRIFTFGVGFDVNTFLLDKIAQDSRGRAEYVKPEEAIEAAISSLFHKISNPFLTDVRLEIEGVEVEDIYPVQIADVYQGERLTLLGRYRNPGQARIHLVGRQGDRTRKYTYQVRFTDRENENEFVAKLWANRKVHHLLTEIRFHGENSELIESVKILGKEYGIITPYTSYLVREQQLELAHINDQVRGGSSGVSQERLYSRQKSREAKAESDDESVGSEAFYDAMTTMPRVVEQSAGKGAVYSSRALKKLGAGETEVDMLLTVKRVCDRTFTLRSGIWIEEGLSLQTGADSKIRFLSDEYFQFLESSPELGKILGLGEQIKFKWKDKIIFITIS